MVQVIEQTYEEKLAMYMKQPKKKLAEMLIECNRHLENRPKIYFSTKVFQYA